MICPSRVSACLPSCLYLCLCLGPVQVHEHLPIYASCIQEFQSRLEQLQIQQAKLAEVLASDKRCLLTQVQA